jgi:hypothetical protein
MNENILPILYYDNKAKEKVIDYKDMILCIPLTIETKNMKI